MTDMCSCSCAVDYDPADVYEANMVKGRKEHQCCECGAVIEVGELHEYVSALWSSEGGWCHWRTCQPCKRIREDLCQRGWYFEGLRETIWECWGFDYVTGEGGDEDEDE